MTIDTLSATKPARKPDQSKPRHSHGRSRKPAESAMRSFQANADFVREIIEESILPELWSAADRLSELDFTVEVKAAGSDETLADYHPPLVAWAEIHVRSRESEAALILRFDGRASTGRWEVTPRVFRPESPGGMTRHLAAAWDILVRFLRERIGPLFRKD